MSMLTWNPLTQTEPERPKCPICRGTRVIVTDHQPIGSGVVDRIDSYPCSACKATGLAPPPRCETCEGTGYWEYDTDGPLVVGGNGEKCPACSGTGHAPWEVVIDVSHGLPCKGDLFYPDGPEGFGLIDNDIARAFATVARLSDMQFYLPVESVESAERAREWIEDDGTKLRMPFYFSEIKEDGQQWPGWPLPNLTILAVAHDQPSLDSVLTAVLAIPAAAHGVWLKGVTGACDLATMVTCHKCGGDGYTQEKLCLCSAEQSRGFTPGEYPAIRRLSTLLISHDVPGGEAATFTASPESALRDSDDGPPAAGECRHQWIGTMKPTLPPQKGKTWCGVCRKSFEQVCVEDVAQQARAAGVRVVEVE